MHRRRRRVVDDEQPRHHPGLGAHDRRDDRVEQLAVDRGVDQEHPVEDRPEQLVDGGLDRHPQPVVVRDEPAGQLGPAWAEHTVAQRGGQLLVGGRLADQHADHLLGARSGEDLDEPLQVRPQVRRQVAGVGDGAVGKTSFIASVTASTRDPQ